MHYDYELLSYVPFLLHIRPQNMAVPAISYAHMATKYGHLDHVPWQDIWCLHKGNLKIDLLIGIKDFLKSCAIY